eukprot:COSAG01_NODE_38836_length_484_cov_2.316883_1_plen_84_part_00
MLVARAWWRVLSSCVHAWIFYMYACMCVRACACALAGHGRGPGNGGSAPQQLAVRVITGSLTLHGCDVGGQITVGRGTSAELQ